MTRKRHTAARHCDVPSRCVLLDSHLLAARPVGRCLPTPTCLGPLVGKGLGRHSGHSRHCRCCRYFRGCRLWSGLHLPRRSAANWRGERRDGRGGGKGAMAAGGDGPVRPEETMFGRGVGGRAHKQKQTTEQQRANTQRLHSRHRTALQQPHEGACLRVTSAYRERESDG